MTRPRAVIYSRVSSSMQERDGVSLDAQVELARRFCEMRGFDLLPPIYDTMSGQRSDRPGLLRVEAMVKAKAIDHVLVYKVDRLSRDAAHYHQLLQAFERQGVGLASLTEPFDATTGMGKFMLTLLIGLAELEADRTSNRVRDSASYRVAQGRLLMGGLAPMGYLYHKAHTDAEGKRVLGRLEVDPVTAIVVRYLFERFIEVGSIRQTVLDANAHGFRWQTGLPLNTTSVRNLLTNPVYCGRHVGLRTQTTGAGAAKKTRRLPRSQWTVTDHTQPAIVSVEMWERAQAILTENARAPRAVVASRLRHPWSGLVTCGTCGGPMKRSQTKTVTLALTGVDQRFASYACSRWYHLKDEGCAGPRACISERYLDVFVAPAILEMVAEAVARSQATRGSGKRSKAPSPPGARLDGALKKLQGKRTRTYENYADGAYGEGIAAREVRDRLLAAIDQEIATLRAQMMDDVPARPLPPLPIDLDDFWRLAADKPGARNKFLRTLVDSIEATKDEVRITFLAFDDPAWPTEPLVLPVVNLLTRKGRAGWQGLAALLGSPLAPATPRTRP